MIEFELDIPSLTEEGIQMSGQDIFDYVKELNSLSMNDIIIQYRC